MKHHRGFTFVEFVIVVAVIFAIAGIVTPFVAKDLDEAKQKSARDDVNRIASAVLRYMTDLQYPPTGESGRASFHLVVSEGIDPTENSFGSGDSTSLDTFFSVNTWNAAGWRGPYLSPVGTDPWGSRYLLNVEGYSNPTERVWVLCAGPDRKVDTAPGDLEPRGDDIAVMLK